MAAFQLFIIEEGAKGIQTKNLLVLNTIISSPAMISCAVDVFDISSSAKIATCSFYIKLI